MEGYQKESLTDKAKRKAKNTLMAGATALGTFGSGAGAFAGETAETQLNPDNMTAVEASDVNPDSVSDDTYIASWAEGAKDDKEKKAENANETISYGETLDLNTYFEMGSAELDGKDRELIKGEVDAFLSNLNQETVAGIRNLELAVVVRAGCSPEKIEKKYTTAGYDIENNNDLANARGDQISKIVVELLGKHGIDNAQIEIHIPTDGVSETGERYAAVSLKEIYREPKVSEFPDSTYAVLLDRSGTMKNDAAKADAMIKELNKNGAEIRVKTIKGSVTGYEAHLGTLEELLPSIEKQETRKTIYILSDETDATIRQVNEFNDPGIYKSYHDEYLARIEKMIEEYDKLNIDIVFRFLMPFYEDSNKYKEIPLKEVSLAMFPSEQPTARELSMDPESFAYKMYEKIDEKFEVDPDK